MGFFSRVWGYVKALVTGGVESRMRPEVQIEQAMAEARKQDLELRNQAARVIAHRTELQMKLDRAIDESAEARAQAGQALKNADSVGLHFYELYKPEPVPEPVPEPDPVPPDPTDPTPEAVYWAVDLSTADAREVLV